MPKHVFSMMIAGLLLDKCGWNACKLILKLCIWNQTLCEDEGAEPGYSLGCKLPEIDDTDACVAAGGDWRIRCNHSHCPFSSLLL